MINSSIKTSLLIDLFIKFIQILMSENSCIGCCQYFSNIKERVGIMIFLGISNGFSSMNHNAWKVSEQ